MLSPALVDPHPRPIRFFHRGRVREVSGLAPTTTVLTWLREQASATGTKEGCNEGDCGACTVVIGQLDDGPGSIRGLSLKPINACLQYLPALDGKALLTVEDLKNSASGALHPVQQAMVDHHASQCGFCTPGFVMTLAASYETHLAAGSRPTRQQLADALSGNLCRCTGYRPILDAGLAMFDGPPQRLDTQPIVQALSGLRDDTPLVYEAIDPAFGTLRRWRAPHTVEQLATLRAARPDATLLAGGTDIGLWTNKGHRDLGEIIYLGNAEALQRIEVRPDHLLVGAAASLEAAWQALAQRLPALEEVWLRFASPPVRHAGTMGGNVANGSPIGDSAPVLIALSASLLLRQGERQREVALDAFYLDYMKNQLEPGEFLQAIRVPWPAPDTQLRVYKISKRFDCDISALCGAFALTLDDGVVRGARLAYGGMAATVRRATHAEAALLGQAWTEATAHAAMAALALDFQPLSDHRASADYRMRVAKHLLLRLWHETRSDAPLAHEDSSVWSTR